MNIQQIELLTSIKEGDETAFEKLFLEYYSSLCVFAKKFVYDIAIAKELTQELFIFIWENRKGLEIRSSIKSYLFQSIRNRCINHLKHIQTIEKRKLRFAILDNDTEFEKAFETAEIEKQIYQLVENLPAQCSKIFKMSRYQDMKYSEIASELDISVKTVETQITKALKILRSAFFVPPLDISKQSNSVDFENNFKSKNIVDEFSQILLLYKLFVYHFTNIVFYTRQTWMPILRDSATLHKKRSFHDSHHHKLT